MRALLLLVVLVAGCGKPAAVPDEKKGGGKAAAVPLREPLTEEIDLQVLAQDYRTNEITAERKYANRRMPCMGYVKKIEKTSEGDWMVRFEYFVDGINWGEGIVVAVFPASESDALSVYRYRSQLKFSGRCDGFDKIELRKCVVLRDCRVISVK